MARIVATAEDFAFGPTGRLITVLKFLRSKHRVVFVGSGTAYQLAKDEKFEEVHYFDSSSNNNEKELRAVLDNADLLISSLDRLSVRIATNMRLSSVYIDGLFWLWTDLPRFLMEAAAYIKIRNFLENERSIKLSEKIKNLKECGPIVDDSYTPRKQRKRVVLINFGGIEGGGWYKFSKETDYPFIMTKIISQKVSFEGFNELVFTGNKKFLNLLEERFGRHLRKLPIKCSFRQLSHDDFLKKLASSSVILTVPGGQTSMEAFFYKIPVIFLPPSNDSQYRWIESFVDRGCGQTAIHWREFFEPLEILEHEPKVRFELLFEQITKFGSDEELQRVVAERITNYLASQRLLRKQVLKQNKYLNDLGGNGLGVVTSTIENMLTTSS